MQQRDAEIASCRLCKVIEHPEWDGKMKGSKT
jgi:hypothetical protein